MVQFDPERAGPARRSVLGIGLGAAAGLAGAAALPGGRAYAVPRPGAPEPGTGYDDPREPSAHPHVADSDPHAAYDDPRSTPEDLAAAREEAYAHGLAAVPDRGSPLLLNRKLFHWTVLQSFAFDEAHGHLYALQVMQGGVRLPGERRAYTHRERLRRGDLCLNRLTRSGAPRGHMFLKGFGHGGAIGVERTSSGGTVLWTEYDANPATGYGRAVARFRFAPGKVLSSLPRSAVYRPRPGSANNTVTLDMAHRRVLLRYGSWKAPRYAVYPLERFLARRFTPLADFAQPEAGRGLPFQGMALHGNRVHQLLGNAYSAGNPPSRGGNTRLTTVDAFTGRVVRSVRDRTAPRLHHREPEGLAVLRGGGAPRLCMGYAHGRPTARRFSLYARRLS